MWVRQWPRFWLELLLKLLGKIFLGCYFGYMGGAILRFLDKLDRIWLGVTEMWLLRKSNQTRKRDERNACTSFRWTFLYPCRFQGLIHESVHIMPRERKCDSTLPSCSTFIFILDSGEVWYVPLKIHLSKPVCAQVWLGMATETRRWKEKRKNHSEWNAPGRRIIRGSRLTSSDTI